MNIINLHYIKVRVAQRIARWTSNPEVVGSNPTVDAFFSFLYNAMNLDRFVFSKG